MIAEHVDDQIAAYAFGALTAEERERVAEHLESCPACTARIEEAEVLAGLLPFSTAPRVAPAEIKRTLFSRLVAEAPVVPKVHTAPSNGAGVSATGGQDLEPPSWALAGRTSRRSGLLRSTVPWTAAVVGWLLAAAFLIYSHGQSDRLRTSQEDLQVQIDALNTRLTVTQGQLASAQIVQGYLTTPQLRVVPLKYMAGVAQHTSVALLMAPHYAHAVVVARGLAILPTDTIYVVWAKARDGIYVRLGTLSTSGSRAEGVALVVGPDQLNLYRQVGLSVEKAGAVSQPSTPLIFAATLDTKSGA